MSSTTSKTMSVMKWVAASLVGWAVMNGPGFVLAQAVTSTTLTEVPIESISVLSQSTTSAPIPTPTPTPAIGTMTVQCWRTTLLSGAPATFPVDTAAASTVTGAVCYEVFSQDGGIARIPVTPGPNFEPLALQSSYSASLASESAARASSTPGSSSSSSSNHLVRVLVPALIGSLVGVILLGLATLYFLRLRTRRKTQSSRAQRWVDNRNSVALGANESWAMKESPSRATYAVNKSETA
ncbi:uncharacterized protein FOMMEDRAFT_138379 [Fomitiporia mediterranea MF3/22]|uniref:uncharacterized protein n=1 Tax=Fomitiporia mediterranea (strain MF3/22) TaxID=694068 RepID=UPI00044080EE|nr:uncharacterized protein FOMMEDRAFT_138379 [Fomitiporia mediterranea MF3/22]EJD06365.1 hypothetical protein FOMMEDRAFT_138379 [Fomitiporia mediterranea MF3/22]